MMDRARTERRRGRRLALCLVGAGILVLGAGAMLLREPIIELWWITRFERDSDGAAAMAKLAEIGGGQSARALLRALGPDGKWGNSALEALRSIHARAGPALRAEIIDELLRVLPKRLEAPTPGGEDLDAGAVWQFFAAAEPAPTGLMPALKDAILHESSAWLAGLVIIKNWPESASELDRALSAADPRQIAGFYREVLRWIDQVDGSMREKLLEIARAFAIERGRPEARAISLSFAAYLGAQDGVETPLLLRAYREDRDPMVRRAALRIAGYLGKFPGCVDLLDLLASEGDAEMQSEIFAALSRWMYRPDNPGSFELWNGFECDWMGDFVPEGVSWNEQEVERLRGLLAKSTEPVLRDAAALVLAALPLPVEVEEAALPLPFEVEEGERRPATPPVPGFKIHEWSAFSGRGGAMAVFFHAREPVCGTLEMLLSDAHPTSMDPPAMPGFQAHGSLRWRSLRIGWGDKLEGPLRAIEPGSRWAALRNVRSSPVATSGRHEPCLRLEIPISPPPPVLATWAGPDPRPDRRTLIVRTRPFAHYPLDFDWSEAQGRPPPTAHLPGVFIIERKAGGAARGRFLGDLESESPPLRVDLEALDLVGAALDRKIEEVLIEQGLARDEARSLVDELGAELFEKDGLRMLGVLAPWMHDSGALLPLEAHPTPEELVRVAVVLTECRDLDIEEAADEKRPDPCQPVSFEMAIGHVKIAEEPLPPADVTPIVIEGDGRIEGLPGPSVLLLCASGERVLLLPGEQQRLQVVDFKALELRFLHAVTAPAKIVDYSIAPDGLKVGFITEEEGAWSMRVADDGRRRLLRAMRTPRVCTWSYFSGDGRSIVFLEDGEPVIVDLETGEKSEPRLPGSGNSEFPTFSPDGTRLMLVRKAPGLEEVLLLDRAARTFQNLGPGVTTYPSLSSNGGRVLFESYLHGDRATWVADLARCRLTRIAGPQQEQLNLPAISADGKRVLLVHANALWRVDVDTGVSRRVYALEGHSINRACTSADTRTVVFNALRLGDGQLAGAYLVKLE